MSEPIDLKLVRTAIELSDKTYYDIDFSPSGDFLMEDGFDTSLIMSIFCEKRAQPYEVAVPYLRRGWWGNTTNEDPSFEIGSKLWLLEQARLTTATLRLAEQYTLEGLKWLKEDKFLQEVSVSADAQYEAGAPSISLEVRLVRSDTVVEYKYFSVWEATGQ